MDEIGAFEAKTRLSELLRQTERGRSFVILRRGKAVARLVPPGHESAAAGRRAAVDALHEIRRGIAGKVEVRGLIERERRYQ
ncbi:MAG: type II toxin-antitoxin system prevent-host-death family antitoxin [Deltaproteobacteria bacterium]|nr:MAG: type II toxin-antitoxin system prevent-host-death family antitoxin [Deltaproteobacteria bacterium]